MSHYDKQREEWEAGALCAPQFPYVQDNNPVKIKPVPTEVVHEEPYTLIRVPTIKVHDRVITEKDIPDCLRSFIQSVPMGREAALAGGAIRSLLTDDNVQDWDVLTTLSYDEAVAFLQNNLAPIEDIVQLTNDVRGPVYTGKVRYVLQFYLDYLDEPVQLIGVDDIDTHIKTEFPLGATRVKWGKSGFSMTQSFLRDMHNKTLTVMNANNLTQKYVQKMKVRYADWGWSV